MSLRKFVLSVALQLCLAAPLLAGPALLDLEPEQPPAAAVHAHSGTLVLTTARSFLGAPYLWGGVTSRGFDCSGFVQAVLKLNGFVVPRLADVQFAQSKKVAYEHLQPGDMVFFSTYLPGASHCGFYLGDGDFIHASSAGKRVMISQMRTGYYRQRFVGGGSPHGWIAVSQG